MLVYYRLLYYTKRGTDLISTFTFENISKIFQKSLTLTNCIFWVIFSSTVVPTVAGDLRLKISFDNNKLGLHFIFHGSASLSLIYRQRCSAQKHGTLDHNTSMPHSAQ